LEDKYDKKKPTSKALVGPQIIDSNFYYVSKTFFIRFNEEELDLNEICSFRAEYDAASEIPSCFFIEADLMFADMNKIPPSQVTQFYVLTIRIQTTLMSIFVH
jgi:hypothetical protein